MDTWNLRGLFSPFYITVLTLWVWWGWPCVETNIDHICVHTLAVTAVNTCFTNSIGISCHVMWLILAVTYFSDVQSSMEVGSQLVGWTDRWSEIWGRPDLTSTDSSKGIKIKQVQKFNYLGSVVIDDRKCGNETQRQTGIVKGAFQMLNKGLKYGKTLLETEKTMLNCYIVLVILYVSECWKICL